MTPTFRQLFRPTWAQTIVIRPPPASPNTVASKKIGRTNRGQPNPCVDQWTGLCRRQFAKHQLKTPRVVAWWNPPKGQLKHLKGCFAPLTNQCQQTILNTSGRRKLTGTTEIQKMHDTTISAKFRPNLAKQQ